MPQILWTSNRPLDLDACLARFTRWGDDLVNDVAEDGYRRVVSTAGVEVAYRARQREDGAVVVESDHPETASEDLARRLAEHLPQEPLDDLSEIDPVVAEARHRRPGYRPPIEPDPFESLITSITAQQVNLRWALTTRMRIVQTFGERRWVAGRPVWTFPRAARLAEAAVDELRRLQLTRAKSSAIVGVAGHAADGRLDGLAGMSDAAVIDRVTAWRGVGRWTADWLLARCLARPHAVAAADLGVRKAVAFHYLGREELPSEEEVRAIAGDWGQAANWATHLLLERLAEA